MTDTTITENDGDDLIPVETPPAEGDTGTAAETPAEDDEDDHDEGDARLHDEEGDEEGEDASANRKRRQKRREMQKRARDAAQHELRLLREQNAELMRRVSAVEGHAIQTNAQGLDARLNQALAEVRQAETIIARATEAGNGEDVVAAMRIRDEAIAAASQLQQAKQQFEQAAQRAQQPAPPQVDPRVASYAQEWMQANPWYDPRGADRDSALTKAIDNELVRDGFDPKTREYWEELTARVADALGETSAPAAKPRRKAPPTGNTREHAPASTKREIYVTPERKAAMIEAGAWDDPVKRQKMLRAYQAYDNGSAR